MIKRNNLKLNRVLNTKTILVLSFFFVFFFVLNIAYASVPLLINYKSRLLNSDGTPVTNPVSIQFSLYTNSAAGSPTDTASATGTLLWKENYDGSTSACSEITPDANGYLYANLGSCTSFPSYLDFNSSSLYLGVKIAGDTETSPRVQFVSVPFALNSERVNGLEASSEAAINKLLSLDSNLNFNIATGTFVGNGIRLSSLAGNANQCLTSDINGNIVAGSTNSCAYTTTNSISVSNRNIITSVVNGVTSTANIIDTSIVSSQGNSFSTTINGVLSNVSNIINSFTQAVTGNVLSTTVNGVTATTSVITGNSIDFSNGVVTSNINGVVATTSITGLLLTTTNDLSSAINTLTSTVNGTTATSSIINSLIQSLSGNTLTTTINGVVSTSSVISSTDLSINGSTLTVTVNGIATSTDVTLLVASSTSNTLSIATSTNDFTITSNVNGKSSSVSNTIINSNVASTTGNYFENIINGISSGVKQFINSFTQSLSGNTLTTTINGVVSTTSVISSNDLTTSGTTLTSNVNGVSTTTDLTNLVASSTSNSISSNVNDITSIVNGKTSSTTIINSNVASSSNNVFQTIVNGISSSLTNIINSFTQSVTGNTLTTTVNGVTATTSVITNNNIDYASGVITSNVNGVVSTTSIIGILPTTTNTLSSSVNTLTSIVNGVTSTASIINTNVASSSGNLLQTIVNGVSSLVTNIINSNSLSVATSTNSNTITSSVNGVSTSTTLTTINSNTIATTTNTLQTIVNGVSSAITNIIGSFTQNLSGNTLTTTINGVVATSSVVSSNTVDFSTTTNTLTSTVNGVVATTSINASKWTATGTSIYYNDGNVGIGTASPNSALDVRGQITSGDGTLKNVVSYSSGYGVLGTLSNNSVQIWTNSSPVITALTNGNIGIGTTNPSAPLHIVGNNQAIRVASSNDTTPTYMQFMTSGSTGLGYVGVEGSTANTVFSGTLPYATFLSSGAGSTALQFGTAGSVKQTILSNGNVGIGTTTPAYKLDVVSGTGSGSSYLRIQSADAGNQLILGAIGAGNRIYSRTNAGGAAPFFLDQGGSDTLTLDAAGAATFSSSVTASSFIKSGGTSSQFLKADGSIDSNTYVTTGSYLPLSGGTLTGRLDGTEIRVLRDGSNSVAAGAFLGIGNAAQTNQWLIQNDASNNLAWWQYNGSAWSQKYVFATDGSITLGSTSGSGTGSLFAGTITSSSIPAGSSGNNFLVSNGGTISYRTPAQTLTDIGGLSSSGNTTISSQTYLASTTIKFGSAGYVGLSSAIFTGGSATDLGVQSISGNIWFGQGLNPKMFFDGTNGRLGINTSAPSYLLDVAGGDINTSGVYRLSATQFASISGSTIAIGNTGSNSLSLYAGAADRLTIRSDLGYVGIGTTGAADKLDVYGTIRSSVNSSYFSQFNYVNGTMLSMTSPSTETSDNMQFVINGGSSGTTGNAFVFKTQGGNTTPAEVMRIDKSGNVGVGTASPGAKLDVNGVINASTGYRMSGGATSGYYLRGNGTDFVSSSIQASDIPTLNQDTTGKAKYLGYTDLRSITPDSFNHAAMTFGFTSYTNNNLSPWADFIELNSYTDGSGGGDNLLVFNRNGFGIRIYQQTWNSSSPFSSYKDVVLAENSPSANFLTKYSGTGNNVSVTNSSIYDNGNVGIGTASPGAKLDVESPAGGVMSPTALLGGNGGNASLTINGNSVSNYAYQTFAQGGTGKFEIGYSSNSDPAGSLFYLNPNVQTGASGAAMVIKGSNVGIGTTSPGYKLDIQGGNGLRIGNGAYDSNLVFGNSGSWDNGIRVYDNGYAEMRIWAQNANGKIWLATGYNGNNSTSLPSTGILIYQNRMNIGYSADQGYTLAVNGDMITSGNIYTTGDYGKGLVGVYSSTRYQGVFAMGDAYKLAADGTSPGNLYGIAWTHENVGGQSKAGLSHQALFMANGVTQTAIGTGIWTAGNITSNGYVSASGYGSFGGALYTGGPIYRTAAGTGYLNGGYAGAETSVTSGAIYSIGGSYVPGTTSLGNMYGIGYGVNNNGVSGFAVSVAGNTNNNWGMYVANNGTANVFLDSDGHVFATGSGYFGGSMNAGSFRINGGSTFTAGNTAQNMKLVGGSGGDVGISGYTSGGTWAFQLYGTSGSYGFLNGNWAGWDMQKTVGGNLVLNGSQTVITSASIGSQSVNYANSSGYSSNLYLNSLGTGSVNVNNGSTAVYRNENGSGAVYPYSPVLHVGGGDTMWQIQGTYGSSGNGSLYFRQGYAGSWGNWLNMLSSANYNSYAPTLTGGGASGTWGINITGSAGSVPWTGITGKPSVMYYQGFTLDADTMDAPATGFTYSVNAPATGPIARLGESGYSLELNAPYSGGNALAFRTRNGDTSSWNSWRYIVTDYNIGSQTVANFNNGSSYSSSGTLYAPTSFRTGDGYTIQDTNQFYCNNGSACYFNWSSSGVTNVGNASGGIYMNGTITQRDTSYIFPGFLSGQGSGVNTSYYLAGSTSWGLYSNTSFNAAGGLYDAGNRVCSPTIGTCSVSITGNAAYASTAGSATSVTGSSSYYPVVANDGYGLCFWNDCTNYKISMGNTSEYHYGAVTSYSMKLTMGGASDFGVTVGLPGGTPTVAIRASDGEIDTQGSLYVYGAELYVQGCYYGSHYSNGDSCYSDITLKKNITTLKDNSSYSLPTLNVSGETTLNKILSLTPVAYNWKTQDDSETKIPGFIAQEVEQVFPLLVHDDPKTGHKMLSAGGILPYTIVAIEELNQKILDTNSTSSALLFSNVGSTTLINNTLQNAFNNLSLFLASTTDESIASTTLANLNDLFSTSSLASIKALTNTLTRTSFDLDLNGNALVNVKSIEGSSKNWKIGDDGICLQNSTKGSVCIDGNKLEQIIDSQNTTNSNTSGSSNTSTITTSTSTSSNAPTNTTTSTSTDTTTATSTDTTVASTGADTTTTSSTDTTASSTPTTTTASTPTDTTTTTSSTDTTTTTTASTDTTTTASTPADTTATTTTTS